MRSTPGKLMKRLDEADRLMNRRQWDEARELLLELYSRYPNHPAVLETLVNFSYDQQDMRGFLTYIYRLSKIMPNDPDIKLNLAGAYITNVYPVLALTVYRQFVVKYPNHPDISRAHEALELLESNVPQLLADFDLSGDEGIQLGAAHDEVRMLMETGQTKQARTTARKLLEQYPDFVPTINNLSLLEFAENRLDEAVAAAKQSLAIDPDNFQALANLTRFLYLTGQTDEAGQYAARLKQATSPLSDIYTKKAETFAYLGDDEAVLEALHQAEEAEATDYDAFLYHLAAVAALRQGNEKDAKAYWKKSQKINPHFEIARQNLLDLRLPVGERHAPWPFPLENWISREPIEEIARIMTVAMRRNDDAAMERGLRRFLDKHPHITNCLPLLLDRGDPAGRELATRLVQAAQTPQLLEALRDFALSRRGPDAMRHQAAQIASQAGLLPKTISIWVNGEQQEIFLMGFEIYDEPHDYNHSPETVDLIQHAIELLNDGNPDEAEEIMLQVLELEPDAPDVLNNLGAIYGAQKRHKEAEEIIRRIHREHPDYFFGIIGMARLHIKEKQLDKAEKLLKPLLQKDRLHISEFKALCISQIQFELADNRLQGAEAWLNMWQDVDPEDPDINYWKFQIKLNNNPLKKARQKFFGY